MRFIDIVASVLAMLCAMAAWMVCRNWRLP